MKKRSLYRNVKTVVDGVMFDSKKEAARYCHLKLLQKAGHISDLRRQVTYPIFVNEKLICKYIADFTFIEKGEKIVEDVKSEFTKKLALYVIKKKLMKAVYGIDIRET